MVQDLELQKLEKEMSLDSYSGVLDRMFKEKKEKHELWNASLTPPDQFIPDEECQEFGIGYWIIPEGIISFRKYKNGYDEHSQIFYEDKFISMLAELISRRIESNDKVLDKD